MEISPGRLHSSEWPVLLAGILALFAASERPAGGIAWSRSFAARTAPGG
jgi:hypothetical protein